MVDRYLEDGPWLPFLYYSQSIPSQLAGRRGFEEKLPTSLQLPQSNEMLRNPQPEFPLLKWLKPTPCYYPIESPSAYPLFPKVPNSQHSPLLPEAGVDNCPFSSFSFFPFRPFPLAGGSGTDGDQTSKHEWFCFNPPEAPLARRLEWSI